MTEPTIRVKLIPDISGISGGIGAGMAGTPAGLSGAGEVGKKAANMITIPITDVLKGIHSGIQKLVEVSPAMQASVKLLKKGVEMALMPIADIFSQLLRPLAMILIRFFGPLMADYYSNKKEGMGGGEALWEALKQRIAEAPDLAIGATLVLGGLIFGGVLAAGAAALFIKWVASLIGIGTVSNVATGVATTAVALPMSLVLGTLAFGGIFGGLVGGKGGAIVGIIAAVLGLGIVYALGGVAAIGVGAAIAIPVALTIVSVLGYKMIKDLIDKVKGSEAGQVAGGAWNSIIDSKKREDIVNRWENKEITEEEALAEIALLDAQRDGVETTQALTSNTEDLNNVLTDQTGITYGLATATEWAEKMGISLIDTDLNLITSANSVTKSINLEATAYERLNAARGTRSSGSGSSSSTMSGEDMNQFQNYTNAATGETVSWHSGPSLKSTGSQVSGGGI